MEVHLFPYHFDLLGWGSIRKVKIFKINGYTSVHSCDTKIVFNLFSMFLFWCFILHLILYVQFCISDCKVFPLVTFGEPIRSLLRSQNRSGGEFGQGGDWNKLQYWNIAIFKHIGGHSAMDYRMYSTMYCRIDSTMYYRIHSAMYCKTHSAMYYRIHFHVYQKVDSWFSFLFLPRCQHKAKCQLYFIAFAFVLTFSS